MSSSGVVAGEKQRRGRDCLPSNFSLSKKCSNRLKFRGKIYYFRSS